MTRKYDYRMQVITIDEAMELLGYNDLVRFVGDVDKNLPTHSIPDSSVDMYSMSELKQFASSIGKEIAIPDEWKERSLCIEEERPREEKETEAPQKRLEHPYMEGHKCLESCSHRDDYGFCKQGDFCTKYRVNTSTSNNLVHREIEDETPVPHSAVKISLIDVQNVLGASIMALADTNLTDKQRESVSKNALTIASVAKTFMNGIDLSLRAYGLVTVKGVDKNKVRNLVE